MSRNTTPPEPSGIAVLEKAWLNSSTPEEFYFEAFKQPAMLRRSTKFQGALAHLEYGKYKDLSGKWTSDENATWLAMIVSDQPGHGGHLLTDILKGCMTAGVALFGEPSALKPRDWDPTRPWSLQGDELLKWYGKRGFDIIQSRGNTLICFIPSARKLSVNIKLS